MALGGSMDGCGNFMKYSMFIVNFIIFLGGVIVVALGIWTVVDKSFANEILGSNLYPGAVYMLIATGLLVTIISCFGCFGSAKEVRCLLLAYFIAVFIIFVTMLLGGILGYVFRAKVGETIKNEMYSSMRLYGNYRPVTDSWDETQNRLECCGVVSYRDWREAIPDSCCKEPTPGKRQRCQLLYDNQNSFTLYQRGCMDVTLEFVKEHAAIIGAAGIVVSCLMLLGMIFSCALFKLIK